MIFLGKNWLINHLPINTTGTTEYYRGGLSDDSLSLIQEKWTKIDRTRATFFQIVNESSDCRPITIL